MDNKEEALDLLARLYDEKKISCNGKEFITLVRSIIEDDKPCINPSIFTPRDNDTPLQPLWYNTTKDVSKENITLSDEYTLKK